MEEKPGGERIDVERKLDDAFAAESPRVVPPPKRPDALPIGLDMAGTKKKPEPEMMALSIDVDSPKSKRGPSDNQSVDGGTSLGSPSQSVDGTNYRARAADCYADVARIGHISQ